MRSTVKILLVLVVMLIWLPAYLHLVKNPAHNELVDAHIMEWEQHRLTHEQRLDALASAACPENGVYHWVGKAKIQCLTHRGSPSGPIKSIEIPPFEPPRF